MGRKYFFKAPYKSDVYISPRVDSEKFTVTEDRRYIVTTEPLTLREYYVAFISEVPFKARVEDRVELVVPDDLDSIKTMAIHACRGIKRMFLSWWTIETEDLNVAEELEIRGNLVRRGVNEMVIRGYGEVETPYTCEDPDDCIWPNTMLTYLYEIVYKYKEWRYDDPVYGGESTVRHVAELFSDPQNSHTVFISDADVDEVEQLLKKAGFDVLRRCGKARARIQIEKISKNNLLIEC
jgi:hypothetical protein